MPTRIPSKSALIAVVALSLAHVASGGAVDDLIAKAIDANPGLEASRHAWRSAEAMTRFEKSLPDPMIGAKQMRAESTSFSDYEAIEYMVQQDVPWPGKRGSKVNAARLEAEAAGFVYLEELRNLRGKVTQAYWNLWLADRTIETMKSGIRLIERMEESALSAYESGKAMQGDVLRAQIERESMQNELTSMKQDRAVAMAELNTLLHQPPDTVIDASDTPPLPTMDNDYRAMQEKARKFCCILLSMIRMRDAKEAAVVAAKVERRPDLQFTIEARQFEESSDIEEYDTAIALNIPWLWHGKYKAAIDRAGADLAKAQAALDQETDKTMLEIQDLHTMSSNARRTLILNEQSILPKAISLVESLSSSYQSGEVRLAEVIDTQRTLLDVQLAAHKARADYGSQVAMLNVIAAPWGPDEIATGLVTEEMNEE